MLPNSFTCFLVDTGTHRVLVDTGFGYNAPEGADAGAMPSVLETMGVSPGEIDHVVFTHLHPDHILGSLDADQRPLFLNATHWTLQREVAHWRSGSDERAVGITRVADILDESGQLHATEEPGPVVPGITAYATYGHTPGHTAVRVTGNDEDLVIAGDVTFSPVHIWHPDWAFPFDVDKPAAAATRAAFFDDLAASGTPFLAGHYDEPGYGRVVVTADGRDYQALPVVPLG